MVCIFLLWIHLVLPAHQTFIRTLRIKEKKVGAKQRIEEGVKSESGINVQHKLCHQSIITTIK